MQELYPRALSKAEKKANGLHVEEGDCGCSVRVQVIQVGGSHSARFTACEEHAR